ncbi:MAG: hypothetical protein U5L96_19045 [Owenweeksia sp.]|nr:hypothetical protein [Owenweeksia sp.]
MTTQHFEKNAKTLIDDLKGVCANYGLGNDGNEFKIITQVFLYKFLNDKFAYAVKQAVPELQGKPDWIQALKEIPEEDYEMLKIELPAGVAELQPEQLLEELFHQQDKKGGYFGLTMPVISE